VFYCVFIVFIIVFIIVFTLLVCYILTYSAAQLQECLISLLTYYTLVLFTNRKSYTSLVRYLNRWPWVTLNGTMSVIMRYFPQNGSFEFQSQLRQIHVATKM